jgi:hypothetical protein
LLIPTCTLISCFFNKICYLEREGLALIHCVNNLHPTRWVLENTVASVLHNLTLSITIIKEQALAVIVPFSPLQCSTVWSFECVYTHDIICVGGYIFFVHSEKDGERLAHLCFGIVLSTTRWAPKGGEHHQSSKAHFGGAPKGSKGPVRIILYYCVSVWVLFNCRSAYQTCAHMCRGSAHTYMCE